MTLLRLHVAAPSRSSLNFRGFIVAILLVLTLQPAYLLGLMALDVVAPADRRASHLHAAFESANDRIKPPNGAGDWDTECIAESIGLDPGSSGSLRNAVDAARPLYGSSTCAALAAVVMNEPNVVWLPYWRYWHGYRIVVDPLTAWLPIMVVRYVLLAFLLSALVFFAIESLRLIGNVATLALIWPVILMTDILWRMWLITPNAVSTICIFAGAALFARKLRQGASISTLLIFSAVLGSSFSYIDFLTNPPWQPMLIAFFILADPHRGKNATSLMAKCSLILAAWATGYALTWASKWMIAAALAPDAHAFLQDVADVARYRISGDYLQIVDHHFLAPSWKVLAFMFHQTWMILLAIIVALMTPILFPGLAPRRFALLAAPAIIPFVWFELLSNHTQIHSTVSYRPIASSVGILLAAWVLCSKGISCRSAR